MTDAQIIATIDQPGFAWDNLPPAEQRNLLGSIQALVNESQQIEPVAFYEQALEDRNTQIEQLQERLAQLIADQMPIEGWLIVWPDGERSVMQRTATVAAYKGMGATVYPLYAGLALE